MLFDQEYGLLPFAPVYIFAATGLVQMWRPAANCDDGPSKSWLCFVALLGTVGAFGIWWGGTAAPARPLASGLLLLMLPIAAAFRAAPVGSARRAAQHLLLWISIGIAITLTVSQDGLLINNARDGTSALLGFWSPRWELWTLAPTIHRASVDHRDAANHLVARHRVRAPHSCWHGCGPPARARRR